MVQGQQRDVQDVRGTYTYLLGILKLSCRFSSPPGGGLAEAGRSATYSLGWPAHLGSSLNTGGGAGNEPRPAMSTTAR
jgi:hypothetical protein